MDKINYKYLSLDPPMRKYFKESDYNLIRNIPDIILLAKRMEEILLENMVESDRIVAASMIITCKTNEI